MIQKVESSYEPKASILYMASKALEDICAGNDLGEDFIAELHSKPAMDCLRHIVEDKHVPQLIKCAVEGSEPVHKLAVSILRDKEQFSSENRVALQRMFCELWDARKGQPKILINLLWRLLDYDDLSATRCTEIYNFIKLNWQTFIGTQLGFLGEGRTDKEKGDPKKVLPNIERRLLTEKKSKHWVYFCASMASDDIPGILRLLEQNLNLSDSNSVTIDFTNKVIEDIRVRALDSLITTVPTEESWREHDALIWGLVHKKTNYKVSYLCSSQCSVQNLHLNNSKISSKSTRTFFELIHELNKPKPDYKKLVEESLDEWEWHAKFVLSLADLGTDNKCVLNYRTNSGRWAKRFSFLYLFALRLMERADNSSSSFGWNFGSFSDPLLINYPIPCRAITSENMVVNLPQIMDAKDDGNAAENFTVDLAKNMRVIQWEVMPRDLFKEYKEREIFQIPKVEAYTGKVGLLRNNEFSDLVKSSWEEEVRERRLLFPDTQPSEVEKFSDYIDKAVKYVEKLPDKFKSNIEAESNDYDKSAVHRYSSFVKYVSEYVNIHKTSGIESSNTESESQLIVAADGELTFFSILHHFRKAEREDISEVLFRLGLLCPVDDKCWVTTERFESFANWFFRIHTRLVQQRISIKSDVITKELFTVSFVPLLPVRHNIDVTSNLTFLVKMYSLLSSTIVFNGILKALVTRYFNTPQIFYDTILGESLEGQEIEDQKIADITLPSPPNKYFSWILSRIGEDDPDEPLLATSRTCNFLLEESLRSYQPYPLSLVIMPFDFGFPSRQGEKIANLKAGIDDNLAVPSAICFASVYGALDYDKDEIYKPSCLQSGLDKKYSPTNVTKEWLNMYWSIFQALSSAISIRSYEKMTVDLTKFMAWRGESSRQGHEFKRAIKCIEKNAPINVLKMVQHYFYGVVLDNQLIEQDTTLLPTELINSDEISFPEFITMLAKYAAKIRWLINKDGVFSSEVISEEEINESSKRFMHNNIIFNNSCNTYLIRCETTEKKKTRIVYSGMIVALLINIFNNCSKRFPIIINEADDYFEFVNTPRGDIAKAFETCESYDQDVTDKFGGTEASLDSYLYRIKDRDMLSDYPAKMGYDFESKKFYTRVAKPIGILLKK